MRPAILVLAAALTGAAAETPLRETAAALLEFLAAGRREAAVPGLERDPALDRVAAERAREVAQRPEPRRFDARDSVETTLRRVGVRRCRHGFLRAAPYAAAARAAQAALGSAARAALHG